MSVSEAQAAAQDPPRSLPHEWRRLSFIGAARRVSDTIGRLRVVGQRDLRKKHFWNTIPWRQQILIDWATSVKMLLKETDSGNVSRIVFIVRNMFALFQGSDVGTYIFGQKLMEELYKTT